jgi:hypothetical protein
LTPTPAPTCVFNSCAKRVATERAASRRGWVWPIRPRAQAEIEADFRQLRRLARAGFATDDDHLMLLNQVGNIGPSLVDRQIALEFRLRQLGPPFDHGSLRAGEQSGKLGIQFFAFFSG